MNTFIANREARERVKANVAQQFLSYLRYEAENGRLKLTGLEPGVPQPLRERLDPASAERFFAVKPGSVDDYGLIGHRQWAIVYRGEPQQGRTLYQALAALHSEHETTTLHYDPTNGSFSAGFQFQVIPLQP